MLKLILVCSVCLLTLGCSSLTHKSVVMGGDVQGVKIITSVDPTTGTISPQVATGLGSFFFIDMPLEEDCFFEAFHQEKSIWSSSPASTRYVRITRGQGKQTSSIDIMVDADSMLEVGIQPDSSR